MPFKNLDCFEWSIYFLLSYFLTWLPILPFTDQFSVLKGRRFCPHDCQEKGQYDLLLETHNLLCRWIKGTLHGSVLKPLVKHLKHSKLSEYTLTM